jgi:hypothetical protein
MSDEKLREPGGGWSNTLLEVAHHSGAEDAMVRMQSLGADDASARAWLATLKHDIQQEPAMPCRWCGVLTQRQVCVLAIPVPNSPDPHNWIGLALHQCAACHVSEQVRILERRQTLDLYPHLLASEAVRLAELRAEVVALDRAVA